MWSLFIAPTVLWDRFPEAWYYKHFCSLVRILNLCLQFEISKEEINEIKTGICQWVVDYEQCIPPFRFQKIEGWLDPCIQPLLPAQAWTTPSVPTYNTCPPPHSWPNQMDGTMLDNMGFPHWEAMWVLSTQHPESMKPVHEHGPIPCWSVTAPTGQNFIQLYQQAAWKTSQVPLFTNEEA